MAWRGCCVEVWSLKPWDSGILGRCHLISRSSFDSGSPSRATGFWESRGPERETGRFREAQRVSSARPCVQKAKFLEQVQQLVPIWLVYTESQSLNIPLARQPSLFDKSAGVEAHPANCGPFTRGPDSLDATQRMQAIAFGLDGRFGVVLVLILLEAAVIPGSSRGCAISKGRRCSPPHARLCRTSATRPGEPCHFRAGFRCLLLQSEARRQLIKCLGRSLLQTFCIELLRAIGKWLGCKVLLLPVRCSHELLLALPNAVHMWPFPAPARLLSSKMDRFWHQSLYRSVEEMN